MTNEYYKDKAAIVTGSSRGIGAAIALRLAADGFAVVVNFAGRVAEAEKVVAQIRSGGGRAIAVQADVSLPGNVDLLYAEAEAAFGAVDVLVNNAGVTQPGLVNLADSDDAMFDHIVGINFKGTFNTLRQAARRLRDGGRIINFSTSLVGSLMPGYSIYAATKSAVEAMTMIFAKELRGRNITVNAVAPGPVATELFLTGKSEEMVERMAKISPMERLGQPEDISGVVSFLAGPDGGWVNGQTLRANGGYV